MRSRIQVVDDLLVLDAQTGHVDAFESLATRWQPRLLRHAHRMTGDWEGAREVTQEAWVAIVRGLRKLDDPACFASWALRITSRRCADWVERRSRMRRRTGTLDTKDVPVTDRTDSELTRVREALARLDPEHRIVMAMFGVEGLTVKEIAEILAIPLGTVKSRLYHAREQLRAALEA